MSACWHQEPSSYCLPFRIDPDGVPYAPCGAVANSMFNGTYRSAAGRVGSGGRRGAVGGRGAGAGVSRNHHILPVADLPTHILSLPDTFELFYLSSLTRMSRVPLRQTGLTWYTDKNIKFRNPRTGNQTLAQVLNGKEESSWILALLPDLAALSPGSQPLILAVLCRSAGTAMPAYWRKPVYELDPANPYNNGFINDNFIVWMREAAFPNFKKLYGILERGSELFGDGLPAGNYSISINYSILSRVSLPGFTRFPAGAVQP